MSRKNLKFKTMMKRFFRLFWILIVLVILCSCASILSKTNWPLTINTKPSGAKVEITNRKGNVVYNGSTPAFMSLKSGGGFFVKESYTVRLTKNGYDEKIIPVECRVNGWYAGNILFGGLIGILIVDPLTGAMYKLDLENINETLIRSNNTIETALRILEINDIPDDWKDHLVSIK